MLDKFEKHLRVSEPEISAIELLSAHCEFPKSELKRIMQNGAVWLESNRGIERIRRAKKILHEGETLHLYYDAKVQAAEPAGAELISDEGGYSIWNKPSGMFSQGSKWGDKCTIYRWAEQHLKPQRPAFIVHRLDRAANGLIIVAHKKTLAASFSAMFEHHEIYKKYRASVECDLSELKFPFLINKVLDNKVAISEIVSVQKSDKNKTLVDVVIKTGRKHQIRRHLSSMGCPIEGDRLYGAKNRDINLQLSAVGMKFICPITGDEKEWTL